MLPHPSRPTHRPSAIQHRPEGLAWSEGQGHLHVIDKSICLHVIQNISGVFFFFWGGAFLLLNKSIGRENS